MKKVRNKARDRFVVRLVVCFCVGFVLIGYSHADTVQVSTGPLLVVKAERVGFVDASGRLLVAPRYTRCGRWSEGRLWVQEQVGSDAFGTFLDEQAKPVSPMQFCDLSAVRPELPLPCFEKGVAVIGMPEGGFGYLNSQGHVLALTTRAGAFQRQDGELLICVVSNRVGFIDREGETVISAQYETATPFRGGRAAVRQGDQWGLLDAQATGWLSRRLSVFGWYRAMRGSGRIAQASVGG